MSAYVVKTVRFWFTPEVPEDQRKAVYQRLWALMRAFAVVKNRVVSRAFAEYVSGKSISDLSPYKHAREFVAADAVPSGIMNVAIPQATDAWKSCAKRVLRGEQALPSSRVDGYHGGFGVRESDAVVDVRDGVLRVTVPLWDSTAKDIEAKRVTLRCRYGERDTLARDCVTRIADGTWEPRSVQVYHDTRIGQDGWCVNLAVRVPVDAAKTVAGRWLGVDLGVTCAAYCAVSDNPKWQFRVDPYDVRSIIRRLAARRRNVGRGNRREFGLREGHGVKAKLAPLDAIGDKIHRVQVDACNCYARAVVEAAVSQACEGVAVEDLTGITKENSYLGPRWPYYRVQSRIETLCKERGLKFKRVPARYTSQRCAECGHVERENRGVDGRRDRFVCLACKHEDHADANAARNIAALGAGKIDAIVIGDAASGDTIPGSLDSLAAVKPKRNRKAALKLGRPNGPRREKSVVLCGPQGPHDDGRSPRGAEAPLAPTLAREP